MEVLPEQGVDALNKLFGRHPGQRAAHAKGILCKGSFAATPDAARLTSAAHMQGEPVEVTVRFSNGSGDPSAPDYARDARGMATKFYLPDGSRTDIVSITLPSFFARTPRDFLKFTRAGRSALSRAIELPLYLLTHREALGAVRAFSSAKTPASYAGLRYNSLHAFRWIDAEGGARFVRYSWLPELPDTGISGAEARRRGPDYLQRDRRERLDGGEVLRFTLQLQLAEPGDAVDDPTRAWPAEREKVTAGTLELKELERGRETGDDVLVFDPMRTTPGIEPSDDPILAFRSRAYSVSVQERSGVPRPTDYVADRT